MQNAAFLAARTVLGLGRYDPWLVNIDAEYHESGATGRERAAVSVNGHAKPAAREKARRQAVGAGV